MHEKDDDDLEVIETENFSSSKDKLNQKTIVLKHMQKCIEEGSKEMVTGGVMKRVIRGQIVEFPRENQIEIFINCVEGLWGLLAPKHKENPKIIGEKLDKIEKIRSKFDDRYQYQMRKAQRYYTAKIKGQKGKDDDTDYISRLNNYQSSIKNNYDYDRVDLAREKLNAMIELIHYYNYFGEESVTAIG